MYLRVARWTSLALLVVFIARAAAQPAMPLRIPAHHEEPPSGSLPETLDPDEVETSAGKLAYRRAAEIKKVLYGLPCYCYCDQHLQHGSLLDCFTTPHASKCRECMKEALYAWDRVQEGDSIEEIRNEVNALKWRAIQLPQ